MFRAYMPELGVNYDTFKDAYDWLRSHNDLYASVQWDAEAADGFSYQKPIKR